MIAALWLNNRPARYLVIEATDDVSTKTATLDAAGCAILGLEFAVAWPQTKTFDLLARGLAYPRGIEVELRHHEVANRFDARWVSGTQASVMFQDVVVPTGLLSTVVLPIVAIDGWEVLAVASWMLHRNDLHLAVPNSRDCCLETDAELDGSCKPYATKRYSRSVEPYLTMAPKVAILTHGSPNCCGSDFEWSTTDDWRSGFLGGQTNDLAGSRFTLAHELGHVMVGIRNGGKERGMYPATAPEDGCLGEQRLCNPAVDSCSPPAWTFVRPDERGVFTKEYASVAAREGWADFMAVWTWNNRSQSNCATVSPAHRYDLDLDGDIDTSPSTPTPANPTPLDCHGIPQWAPMSGNPLASWMSDRNWLGDVVASAAACGAVTNCGIQSPLMETWNRSTVYDWSKMLWYMTQEEDVPPDILSDIYVDMCPREWRPDDGTCFVNDDLPFRRFILSATHHGQLPAASDQVDHVLH